MDHYISPRGRTLGILPNLEAFLIKSEDTDAGKARRVCDYLAGLTDGEAIRIYRRLFDPEFGSITDLA
jgi:dGTPase